MLTAILMLLSGCGPILQPARLISVTLATISLPVGSGIFAALSQIKSIQ